MRSASPDAPSAVEKENRVVARATGNGKFQQAISAAGYHLVADEPLLLGGNGGGPNPYDFIGVALAACTSMTIKLYADRKQMLLPGFEVVVSHDRVHATDCASCEASSDSHVDRFTRRIVFDSPVDAAVEASVLAIADKCPAHRTLSSGSQIVTSVAVTA